MLGQELSLSFGPAGVDDPGDRDSVVEALVERAHPDDWSELAELDARPRRVGFGQT